MKRTRTLIIFLAICLAVGLILWKPHMRHPSHPTTEDTVSIGVHSTDETVTNETMKSLETNGSSNRTISNGASQPALITTPEPKPEGGQASFLAMFQTPISFFGKVVDENGNPISDAKAKLVATDRPWESGSRYERASDSNGLFSLTGVRGASLAVDASKDGYHTSKQARLKINYGGVSGKNDLPIPTASNPALLVLTKIGQTDQLIHIPARSFSIKKDGTPVYIDLESRATSSASISQLQIEAWTDGQSKDEAGRYDWKCRLSIPNGGLIATPHQKKNQAVQSGYQPFVEIVMHRKSEAWKPRFSQEYLVRFQDNRHARFSFEFTTEGGHFLIIESFLNPVSGSLNLEFDPNNAINR